MDTESNILPGEKLAALSWTEPESLSWLDRISAWHQRRKLQRELRRSEQFQKECEKLRCFNLAALEEQHRTRLIEKMKWIERRPKQNFERTRRTA